MSEFLDATRKALRERIEELAPLVEEWRQLVAAEKALEPAGESTQVEPGQEPAATTEPKKRGRRATGETREKIMAVIAQRPGASAREIAEAAGLKGQSVYSMLTKLSASHEVVAEHLPSGVRGYRLPPAASRVTLGVTTAGPPPVKDDAVPAYVTQEA